MGAGATSLDAASASDQGTRTQNEDAALKDRRRGLFAVIDGMGGEGGGEEAARLALEAIAAAATPRDGLRAAAVAIRAAARGKAALASMGAVATVAQVEDDRVRVAHCGDTRAYLVTSLGCEQLTRDHTVAHEAQERLSLRPGVPVEGQNVVTHDLGAGSPVDEATSVWREGDLLFLCTDGIHGALPSNELSDRLVRAWRAKEPANSLVDDLVRLAKTRGSGDNATAVAVFHRGSSSSAAARTQRFGLLAVLIPLLTLLAGILLSPRVAPWLGRKAVPPQPPAVQVAAVEEPRPHVQILRGPSLPREFAGDLAVGVIPFVLVDPTELSLPRSPFEIRALDLEGRSPRLTFRIPEGSSITLSRSRLNLPQTDVEFVLEGPSSTLALLDTSVLAKSLRFSGPSGSRVTVDRATRIQLPGRDRARVDGVALVTEGAR